MGIDDNIGGSFTSLIDTFSRYKMECYKRRILLNKEMYIKKNEESGSIDYSLNIDECEIIVEKKSY